MKAFTTLTLLASASTTLAWSPLFERTPSNCLADLCLRAVSLTHAGQGTISQAADCTNYLVHTVTPATKTVVAVVTSTASTTKTAYKTVVTTIRTTVSQDSPQLEKRGPVTASIPAYASACGSPDRYFSACSCAGFLNATVTTLPTPLSTITTTKKVTKVFNGKGTTTVDVFSTSTIPASLQIPPPPRG